MDVHQRSSFIAERLIKEVEKHPVIWNVNHTAFNNRQSKHRAWIKICHKVFPRTVAETGDEARKLAFIQKKWKSVRDYYNAKQRRDADPSNPNGRKKKYIYSDILTFLENGTSNTETSTEQEVLEVEPILLKEEFVEDAEQEMVDTEKGTDFAIETTEQFSITKEDFDEDEMFLLSLLPSIRKLTPLQKFTFKIQIMSTLKDLQFPE